MKIMKKPLVYRKLCSMLLALALCAALLPAPALADSPAAENLWMATGRSWVNDVPQAQSTAVIGNSLYLLSYNGLYVCRPGEGEPVLLETQTESGNSDRNDYPFSGTFLFVQDGVLYCVNNTTGDVYQLVDASGAAAVQKAYTLDISALLENEEEDMAPNVTDITVQNGKLYLLTTVYTVDGQLGELYEADLTAGAKAVRKAQTDFASLCPYKDGQLLAITISPVDGGGNVQSAGLMVYDPAADTARPLYTLPEADYSVGIAYDAQIDRLYFGLDSTIYAYTQGDKEAIPCAYLPERCMPNTLRALSGGMVSISGYSGLYLRTPDLNASEGYVLTISGEYGSNVHMRVVAEHPELMIKTDSAYLEDMEKLASAMVSGDATVDVLSMSSSYQPVEELIRKGYAADLSAWPEIMAIANRMDPRLLAPFTVDGKLYAVPVAMYTQTPTVNMTLWTETLGLTPEELPATYPEFLDFLANFAYDYGYDHEDINLLDCWDMRSDLLTLLLQNEIAYQQREGATTYTFQTPRFQSLLTQLDSIDDSQISMNKLLGENATDADYQDFYEKPSLFSLYGSIQGPQYAFDYPESTPFLPALEEGLDPVLPAQLTVLIINPRSQHMEAAATYVASYLSNLEPANEGITLFADSTAAVPNDHYDEELAYLQKQITDMETAIQNADEEQKAEMQDQLGWLKKSLESQEDQRFLVTEEEISRFKVEISPYLYPARQNPITTFGDKASSSLRSLLDQYVEKAITSESFISELENRMRLIQLENQ